MSCRLETVRMPLAHDPSARNLVSGLSDRTGVTIRALEAGFDGEGQ